MDRHRYDRADTTRSAYFGRAKIQQQAWSCRSRRRRRPSRWANSDSSAGAGLVAAVPIDRTRLLAEGVLCEEKSCVVASPAGLIMAQFRGVYESFAGVMIRSLLMVSVAGFYLKTEENQRSFQLAAWPVQGLVWRTLRGSRAFGKARRFPHRQRPAAFRQ